MLTALLTHTCPKLVTHTTNLQMGTTNVFEQLTTYTPNELIARLYAGMVPPHTT